MLGNSDKEYYEEYEQKYGVYDVGKSVVETFIDEQDSNHENESCRDPEELLPVTLREIEDTRMCFGVGRGIDTKPAHKYQQ